MGDGLKISCLLDLFNHRLELVPQGLTANLLDILGETAFEDNLHALPPSR
jgi:hypothetical protein